ncbi:MAG TPA: DUF134 domain-containing protein [Bacteroidales bacterium]|nr:DUF134 domain-containing protein [Bacteroidales bacterium]
MPRPKHKRLINNPPVMEGFKPFGIPIRDLEPVILLFEEYNSIRLCDYEGMTQEQAAIEMGISRPTFTRVYEKARRSIAKAFVEGKAIFIEGGDFKTDFYWYRCNNCMKVIISKTIQNSCNYCRGNSLKPLNKPAE